MNLDTAEWLAGALQLAYPVSTFGVGYWLCAYFNSGRRNGK